MNIEYEESFTPRDVYSWILEAHWRLFLNSEPFTSETYERTDKHSYQRNYVSNVSSDKPKGNISRKTDQFIISKETLLRRSRTKRS